MAEDKKLRHPAGGGYARGGETRQRIIAAAIEVFGERGFNAATTREIAVRAEVNPPALQYYFENKEGLYRACADYIVCTSQEKFKPVIDEITKALDDGASAEQAIGLFCKLQEAIIDHVLGSEDMRSRHLFMAREQAGHGGPEGSLIANRKEIAGNHISECGAAVLSRITGLPADAAETKLRAMMLFGQALVFHVARPAALSALGWSEIDAEKLLLLKNTLRDQTTGLLSVWVR